MGLASQEIFNNRGFIPIQAKGNSVLQKQDCKSEIGVLVDTPTSKVHIELIFIKSNQIKKGQQSFRWGRGKVCEEI
jgi:hypothetical protein